jgi:uncharacterized protein
VSGPWLVPVTLLRRNVGQRLHEHREGRLEELHVAASRIRANAPVVVDAVLASVSGGIEVIGTVEAPWEGECRRCLRAVGGELVAEVRELYRPGGPAGRADTDEETYELIGDHLDLAPLARDVLLLELPLAPLCQPDCAGLCPICGGDRNAVACSCAAEVVDPRWGPLEALKSGPEAP